MSHSLLKQMLAASAVSLGLSAIACARPEPKTAPSATERSPQRVIVENAALSFKSLREKPEFEAIDAYLARARAVLIFPRLVKASLIFGGEGGNGVMVTRKPDGTWSNPAFYSLGGPSVGLQVGYREATVVLFILDEDTVRRALHSSLTLGTQSGVAIGNIGADERSKTQGEPIQPKVYQVVEAGGLFAGASLDGSVIHQREKHNTAYYGPGTETSDILVHFEACEPGVKIACPPGTRLSNQVLHDALR